MNNLAKISVFIVSCFASSAIRGAAIMLGWNYYIAGIVGAPHIGFIDGTLAYVFTAMFKSVHRDQGQEHTPSHIAALVANTAISMGLLLAIMWGFNLAR